MKLTPLITLIAVGAVAVAAQQQEVRIVTSDTRGPMSPAMAGGSAPMPTGGGVIFGQVTEADSTRPVPGAIVTLNLPGVQPLRVMADGQGRFGFRLLPKGRFNVTATRPGWVDGAYGRTRPAGPTLPIALADGERASGIVIPLWRFASISGRVVDESSDPLVNMPVQVLKRSTIGGKMGLRMVQMDTTDDRGVYRIGELEPGEYVVVVPMQQASMDMPMAAADGAMREVMAVRAVAMADTGGGGNAFFFNGSPLGGAPAGLGEDGRPLAFPTMFYPNATSSARATAITVASGEERTAVDFQLKGVPISKVSGVATGPDGPVPNLQLSLVPADADDTPTSVETLNGFSDAQGRFTVTGVPPGQYILRAVRMPRPGAGGPVQSVTMVQGGQIQVQSFRMASSAAPLPTDPTLWAEMTIAVGAKDLSDVTVGLRPGVKMSGTVQFNGSAERPATDQWGSIGVTLEPAEAKPGLTPARGRVEATGQFNTVGVPPGRYFLRVNGGFQNWSFQSATVNGRDASVVPIEIGSADLAGVMITFTDRPTELSGQVTSEGTPDAMTVLVFPAEASAWVGYGNSSRQFANIRVDKQGNYKVSNLPAGDYLAIAIPDKMANDWQNPKFLQSLVADATRVHIRDGDKATAGLKVAR